MVFSQQSDSHSQTSSVPVSIFLPFADSMLPLWDLNPTELDSCKLELDRRIKWIILISQRDDHGFQKFICFNIARKENYSCS